MTSMAMAGERCRALRDVVDWDRGGSTMLFPDEVEIIAPGV
jgi:hypothetical protein